MYKSARLCPDINFVLIGLIGAGKTFTPINKLKSLKNIFFLGSKDYDVLYKYFHFGDVAFIARKLNKSDEGPMKYFEFLAAGFPVVVTDIKNIYKILKDSRLGGIV